MLDKDKLREKREKEMEDSVNLWQSFLSEEEKNSDKEPKKEEKNK